MEAVCTNFGNCAKADHQDPVTVFQGGDFACPECGNRMSLVAEPPHKQKRAIISGICLVALLLLLGWMLKTFSGSGGSDHVASPATGNKAASTGPGARHTSQTGTPAAAGSHPGSAPAQVSLPSVPTSPAPFGRDPGQPATVRNLGIPILTEFVANDRMSPESRAAKIAARLNDCFVNDLKPPRTVLNLRQGNLANNPNATEYVFFGYLHANGKDTADIIATVDAATAAHYNVAPVELACWWRDILRDWLLIDQGQAPRFTVPYSPVLMDFYKELAASHGDMPGRFKSATRSMIDAGDEYEKIGTLSGAPPANYHYTADNYQPILNDDSKPETSG
ncbi:MAG: hypothetical protein LC772_01025 [Chloroflexi bacterium]|nr:hypothetical protein [Chloroflexota bacterium]